MKQYLIIKLKNELDTDNLHWSAAVKGDFKLPEKSIKPIDDIFKNNNLKYFIANEYQSESQNIMD